MAHTVPFRFIVILRHKVTKVEAIKEVTSIESAFPVIERLAISFMNMPENWEVVEVDWA